MEPSITDLQERLDQFAKARDWDQFHDPKNLAMALAGEAGELLSLFQWLTPQQAIEVMSDDVAADNVRDELADVFGYLVRLAALLEVDLSAELVAKIERNEIRYPASEARGNARKYDQLQTPDR